jgi:flagellin
MAGIRQAVDNSQRASNVIATAEGALNEVASLLVNIKQLAVQAANTGGVSPAEIKANQLQIDSAVQSITRIANVTNFAGLKLLDGSMDYVLSGVNNSELSMARVFNAQFGETANVPVEISVITSAQTAQLEWQLSATAVDVTLEVAGNNGVETFNFKAGTSAQKIIDAINNSKSSTGVSAIARNGDPNSGVLFYSTGWGSNAFVKVEPLANAGTFDTYDAAGVPTKRSSGRDVAASVNGGYAVGDGLNLSFNSTYLSLDVTLDKSLGAGTSSFVVTGGGAVFQLGPHVSINEQRGFGIQSIAASNLGNGTIGFLSQVITGGAYSLVSGEAEQSAKIIDEAITQVASLRGRLGAFEKNTLQTNISSLEIALENVTASESSIRDADFASETAALTRGQILTKAATSVLAIANATPQSVLSLLQ